MAPILKSQSGFSIISVLITVAMVSVITLAQLIMTKTMLDSQRTVEQRAAAIDFTNEIEELLSDPEACERTFQSVNVNSISATDPAEIQTIKKGDGSDYVAQNASISNSLLNLAAMEMDVFTEQVPGPPSRGVSKLKMYYGKRGGHVGSPVVFSSFKLLVTRDASSGSIIECSSDASTRSGVMGTRTVTNELDTVPVGLPCHGCFNPPFDVNTFDPETGQTGTAVLQEFTLDDLPNGGKFFVTFTASVWRGSTYQWNLVKFYLNGEPLSGQANNWGGAAHGTTKDNITHTALVPLPNTGGPHKLEVVLHASNDWAIIQANEGTLSGILIR